MCCAVVVMSLLQVSAFSLLPSLLRSFFFPVPISHPSVTCTMSGPASASASASPSPCPSAGPSPSLSLSLSLSLSPSSPPSSAAGVDDNEPAALTASATSTTSTDRPSATINDSVLTKEADSESFPCFPVFEQESAENTPSSPPTPPARRRSRNVTEHDLRAFRGLPKRKVFDYVDLVKTLRFPSEPGKLPKAPVCQLGKEATYQRANPAQVDSFEPAPWAQ